ncbi:gliding motility-associated C-terminal domain-containing protein [Lishizhenia sp.]|uniref:T9SS type B sorting domain-containing protein n=1 Tax=Lishizhenia sp. TaxID=2497594 RepID=UPI00299DBEF5|nr:gliding motility-associated C-terminal domain-containing protein [Lishizhenia sp.]MDX1444596.1 gliding motility-associated C-terminal domain-containing protein [Lishizhenia sp.]
MKDKDIFKEVFSEKLKEHSVDVNPQLWSSISSQVGASASAAGTGSALGLGGKIILGVAAVATLGTATYFIADRGEEKAERIEQSQADEQNIQDTEEIKEGVSVIVDKTVKEVTTEAEIEEKPILKDQDEVIQEVDNTEEIESLDPLESVQSNKEDTEVSNRETLINKEQPTTDENEVEEDEPVVIPTYSINYEIDRNIYTFSIEGGDFDAIEWDFGNNDYSLKEKADYFFETPGRKTVKAIIVKGDETIEESITLNVEVAGKFIRVPNTFTPSNDGSNDTYFLESEGIESANIRIVDQQQQVVFESNDVNFVWNGVGMDGSVVKEGTYHLIIIAEDVNGYPINLHRTITIFR